MPDNARAAVSFDSEPLILVDEHDREIGHLHKRECHQGHGVLHRAFSIFLFDECGRVLLQQRAESKPLWPLYWSNSCCSHPRRGESLDQATHRRLREELGLDSELVHLYKFIYQADYGDIGAEHELCHVFIGAASGAIEVHPDEIADWRWTPIDEVTAALESDPEGYTPWFRMEWKDLMERWRAEIDALHDQRRNAAQR